MTVFNPSAIDLPICDIIPQVRRDLADSPTVILSSPPGAGKSTVIPLALLNEPWLKGRKIVMLEPRRLAASSIAHRMAALLGETAGGTVGYRVRFENQTSSRTRIEVVTEGILTRMLHQDNALEDVGMVIFDEFHERRLHTDLSLVLCRESQQVLRPDLRLLIMSATVDTGQLRDLLGAPVVESGGRLYPVDIIHTDEPDLRELPDACARTILRAYREQTGDILAFLPGEGEIRACVQRLAAGNLKALIYPLYGRLSLAEQHAAIRPDRTGRRKIVLATSIAETSLTIDGVTVVVDTGYTRLPTFDPTSGLSRLKTVRISRDMADQRTGRAGRLAPGTCYRMWSPATNVRMLPYRVPEILEADLTALVLDTAQWGIPDPGGLAWLTPPPATAVAQARDLLQRLGALDGIRITSHGKAIHNLPCHPRLAHMLLTAEHEGMGALAADLAALLEERDPLDGEAGTDVTRRIETIRRYRRDHAPNRRFDNIEKIARSYRSLLGVSADNGPVDPYDAGRLLAYAYPERIARAREDGRGTYQLANGRRAALPVHDDLIHEPWLAAALVDAREGTGRIFLAAPVRTEDLITMTEEQERVAWDAQQGTVVASRDRRIGSLTVASEPLNDPDEDTVANVLCQALRVNGSQLLSFTEYVEQWQYRVLSLRHWRPDEGWPEVSTHALLQDPGAWLSPYLTGIRKAEALRRLDLLTILQHTLDYDQQQALDRLAPVSVTVPTGSVIRLRYSSMGEPPVLAVRLQEVFGMTDTPRVNDGQIPIVLHLLSPGFKPVQVTTDLRSFWQHTYFEVRKELKRRYPKHAWPDDPLTATAVRSAPKR